MKRVLITGGRGFLGRNLAAHLRERDDLQIAIVDREETPLQLNEALLEADIIFHLAGVNRPKAEIEFEQGNVELTEQLCQLLQQNNRKPKIVFSSSIQAEVSNPYGLSKLRAEKVLQRFGAETGACVRIFRLKNLFGKWCRPGYNSVTATFCHNIANDLPISISDPEREIDLTYVDDAVTQFAEEIENGHGLEARAAQVRSYCIRLGDLAGRIQSFHEMRSTLTLPDFACHFNRALYATYLSYLPLANLLNALESKADHRGSLAEFLKQGSMGQIFISRTKPGVTRGNHYHHTKAEKFLVLEGTGLIRLRSIGTKDVVHFITKGEAYQVVDIPPGVAHSITNAGSGDMVTLFWSSEMFDPSHPDTYFLAVEPEAAVI